MGSAGPKLKFTGVTKPTSLTVEEIDGSPTVPNVNTIKVSNGTLTDDGGGVVTVITGGGGGSIIVTDGVTTVNPTTTIDFTSGATVTDGGGGTAEIAIAGGGVPAGSTGEVQFNDAGAFGADSNFFWDDTNKRLGLGTGTPGVELEVVNTSEQIRAAYDAANYTDQATDSSGAFQIIPTGGAVLQPSALTNLNRHASWVLTATTADATPTAMTVVPAGLLTMGLGTTWFFDCLIVGKVVGLADSITVKLEGAITSDGAVATVLGAVFNFVVHTDNVNWEADALASGNDLSIVVTGTAATDMFWTAHIRTAEVVAP